MEVITQVEQKLYDICTSTSSDFSAFADVNQQNQAIHWKYAHGNINERYKHMVGKPGKGLSGSVVRFGTSIIVDSGTPGFEKLRMQYPIMLAENLYAAVAVPVYFKGNINGILLVGSRTSKKYTMEQINQIKAAADDFTVFYNKEIS
ncbi:GAF domain-containing protein [Fredinandcohnia sp. 179-A 10B2 NHS]|uniref:GAF domain-containing protein n=1 Tax=Fredinandcohnia sp. 179-A 10B2 NHS TaxID=3235176 RepID=UPI0039A2C1EF